jgi:hypothetical protein
MTLAPLSDFDTFAEYSDTSHQVKVDVQQRTYAWSSPADSKYVIWEYVVRNTSTQLIQNLYTGLFVDWDINNLNHNKSAFASSNAMGYSWCSDFGGQYGAIKLLTNTAPVTFYALDNVSGGAGGIDISGGFTKAQKYRCLMGNRFTAGTTGSGNDVCNVLGTGPVVLFPGQAAVFAFALIAGDNVNDLITSSSNAEIKYLTVASSAGIKTEPNQTGTIKLYPNPATDKLYYATPGFEKSELEIIDVNGQVVLRASVGNAGQLDTRLLARGIYMVKVQNQEMQTCKKLVLE